jgi:hypothetical protein
MPLVARNLPICYELKQIPILILYQPSTVVPILYQLVGTCVLQTLWSPPVSLNQERHTQRRKAANFIFILYRSVLEAWGGLAGPMRTAQAGLARWLSGRFLGGVPQTQTSKDLPFDVDTRLAMVPNLWTNSNNRLQPPSSTQLSRNLATFYLFC